MEFKEGRAFTDGKGNFCNEMVRFASEEAACFSGGENETASAKLDRLAERALVMNANKNEIRKNSIKAQIKEMKNEEKLWEKENERTFSKRTDSDAVAHNKRKKQLTKEQKKQSKKQAAKTAIAKFFKKKKDAMEAGSKESSGDAFADGKDGLVGAVLEAINPMHYLKMYIAKMAALLAPFVVLFMTIAIIVVVIVALLFDVLQPVIEVKNAINSFVSFFTGGGGGSDDDEEEEEPEPTFVTSAISESDIDDIIAELECDEAQEKAVRFALSKVGSPYSQAQRTSGTSFDCSSLVYYAWSDADMDIGFGNNGPPTAAEEARLLNDNGKKVELSDPLSFRFEPGDLIFYGGSDNGRYKGIYHVAMYVGDLKCVEALNDIYGVVYRDLCAEDAIMICRPGQ